MPMLLSVLAAAMLASQVPWPLGSMSALDAGNTE